MHFESDEDAKRYFTIVLMAKEGHIGEACKALGIKRKRFREWFDNDPEFAADCQDSMESLIDLAQSKLVENIKDNVSRDIQFFLKSQARHRGYGDRVEHEHTGIVGHAHLVGHYPPEPKSIAEWEKQVADADKARKLRDNPDEVPETTESCDTCDTCETTETTETTETADPIPDALALVPACATG
jgi:hypothetical protein